MGPLFNPRRLARTPGFIQDGLYDDLDMAEQDDYSALPPPPQQGGGLSEMLQAAPDAPLPPPRREYDGGPSVDPGPQERQRITLEAAPLPPKPGLMRKIIGMAAGAYMPQVGREIMAPGYDRQMREYNANKQRQMDEGKLNYQQAQEDAQVAAARAAMARAEESNAKKQRTMGQMANDKNYNLGPGYARFDASNNQVAVNKLPDKPKSTIKIGRDGKPFIEPGKEYLEIDSAFASAVGKMTPQADKGIAGIAEIVAKKMPGATQEDQDAEIVKIWTEQQKLKSDKEVALTNRANRAPVGRNGGATGTATANAETRRRVDELAKEQVFKAGGDPNKAIANMEAWPERDETAEKVLLHLKAMQGAAAMRPSKGKVDVAAIAARFGAGAPTAPKAPTSTPKPADKNKDPLGVR